GFDPTDPPPPPIATFDRHAPVVTVGSLSKVFWGGLRTGWLRAPAALVEALVERRLAVDLGSPVIDQHVALALIPSYAEVAAGRARQLAAGHAHLTTSLARALPEWETAPARGGLSAWIRVPGVDAAALAAVAARHGVTIIPGSRTAVHGTYTDHVRLTVVLPTDVMDAAVDRLVAAWDELRSGPTTAHRSLVV
ncbi:MAG TPA: aminotransferase class I/II-fold pyridoxal phosphate-dependent enzyme, partial [Acidimicrobiales bacterium]|nr:aminotransferase class I/II-fold pyridoxal phosphate-dependent enzyme [Acidimicrobiales bacterium]